jgi:hypothetical protein
MVVIVDVPQAELRHDIVTKNEYRVSIEFAAGVTPTQKNCPRYAAGSAISTGAPIAFIVLSVNLRR